MPKKTSRSKRKGGPALGITDLIDKATLQALQQRFSQKHDVPTAVLDRNADPITFELRHDSYCQEVRKTKAGYDHCRRCDRRIIATVLGTGRPCWRVCNHGGLLDFAAPLSISGEICAFFFVGQIRGRRGRKATDGISESLRQLHSLARKTDEESVICDASLKRRYALIPQSTKKRIDRIEAAAIEFAEDLTSALTKLVEWQRPQHVSRFVSKMILATDLDELLDICVANIPKLLGTNHCSVFTVETGHTRASARLVLRRTSYGPSKNLEGSGSYRIGQGLTGWVWKNRRALRLKNVLDQKEMTEHHGLRMSQHIVDGDRHREWLGVPLFRRQGDVIGVIRVSEKKRSVTAGGGGFTFENEILLMSIGQHVARQIEELRTRGRAQTAMQASSECAVKVARAVDSGAVASAVLRACQDVWGTRGKSYFFNLLDGEGTLRIEAVVGSLASRNLEGTALSSAESISGQCLRRGRPVIIHDLEKAPFGAQPFPAAQGFECAASAPIRFRKRTFGTLSVGGTGRYEFSKEPDLRILGDLASLAGTALARMEAERQAERAFSEFSRRAGHTLVTRIATLETRIGVLRAGYPDRDMPGIDALDDCLEFMKSAADLALRFGRGWEPAEFRKLHLGTLIERVAKFYPDPRFSRSVPTGLEMLGDALLIEQMLIELINNALRFLPKENGKVVLRAFGAAGGRRGQGPNRAVVIEVEDNGPGVRKDQKQVIFTPYQTSAPGGTRLGLGLSIVKRVAEAHGGHVEECGETGKGACFRITIPQ